MTNTLERQKAVVRGLWKKTLDHSLEWKHGAAEDVYQVAFPRYSVLLSIESPAETSVVAKIRVLNEEGEVVDEFTDETFGGAANDPASPNNKSWWATMYDMHSMARRLALGADAALDEILSELK